MSQLYVIENVHFLWLPAIIWICSLALYNSNHCLFVLSFSVQIIDVNRFHFMLSLRITNLSAVARLKWPHSAQKFVDSIIESLGAGNTLPFNVSLGADSPVQPILLSAGDTKFDTLAWLK